MNFTCPHCGNTRPWLPDLCAHCGSDEPPIDGPEYVVYNLEAGAPLVDEALRTVDHVVDRAMACGIRGLILIHGHGSSGKGGAIRRAFREGLEGNFWAHKVVGHVTGEELRPGAEAYTRLVERRPALRAVLRRDMMGNPGLTVLLLAKR